ncbi:hypothetical protein AB0G06_02070 [Nonomuraea dietziae]|uniref:hypothetical protein n=1 Tax=Nonomuraea dietziae TaxID=65515 RepID=UPI0033C713F6
MRTHDDIAKLTPGELARLYYARDIDHLVANLEVTDVDGDGVVMGVIYDPK